MLDSPSFSGTDNTQSAFDRAIATVKGLVSDAEFNKIQPMSLESLMQEAKRISDELKPRMKLASNSKVNKLALNIEPYASVLQGFFKSIPKCGEFIWGIVSYLLSNVRNNITVLEEVLEFFTGMAEEIKNLIVVETMFKGSEFVVGAIEDVYVAIMKFWMRAIAYYSSKRKTNLKSLLGAPTPTPSEDFAGLKGRIAAHGEQLHRFQQTQYQAQQFRRDLFRWIDAPFYEQDFREANDARHRNTCNWLREKPEYQDWLHSKMRALLVIYGTAGMGKTILSSWLVNEAMTRPTKQATLYHFFKGSDDRKSSPLAAAQSLLKQFYEILHSASHPQIRDLESKLYAESCQSHVARDFEALWKIISLCFLRFSQLADPITIVFDAIDECTDPRNLIQSLRRLVDSASDRVHIVITSRPSIEIVTELRRSHPNQTPPITLQLTQENVKADIAAFVEHHIQHSERLQGPSHRELRDSIIRVFGDVKKHQGMFLWVRLMCNEVNHQLTEPQIWELLECLPEGLDDIYARICKRLAAMDKRSREFGRCVLGWITASKRPMTFVELEEVLNKKGEPLLLRNDILRCCGDFVRYNGLADSDIIDIVHLSARQFLTTHPSKSHCDAGTDDVAFFYVDIPSIELKMAAICVEYLHTSPNTGDYLAPPIRTGQARTPGQDHFGEQRPFFTYATLYWAEHGVNALRSDLNKAQPLLKTITKFTQSLASVIWLEEVIRLTYVEFVQQIFRRFMKLDGNLPSPVLDWSRRMLTLLMEFPQTLTSHPQMVRLCISLPSPPSGRFIGAKGGPMPLVTNWSRKWINYDPATDNILAVSFPPGPTLECHSIKTGISLRPMQLPPDTLAISTEGYLFHSAVSSWSPALVAVTCQRPSTNMYLTILFHTNSLGSDFTLDNWATHNVIRYSLEEHNMFSDHVIAFRNNSTVITPGGVYSLKTMECIDRPDSIFRPDPHTSITDTWFSRNGERVARIRDGLLEVLHIDGTSMFLHELGVSSTVTLKGFSDAGKKVVIATHIRGKPALFCVVIYGAIQIEMSLPIHGTSLHDPVFTRDEERFLAMTCNAQRPDVGQIAVWTFLQNSDGSYCGHADMIYIFGGSDFGPRFLYDLAPGSSPDSVEDVLIVENSGNIIRRPLDMEWSPDKHTKTKTTWVMIWIGSLPDLVLWSIQDRGVLKVERWSFRSPQPILTSCIEESVSVRSLQADWVFHASPDGNFLATEKAIFTTHTALNGFRMSELSLPGKMSCAAFSVDEAVFACICWDRSSDDALPEMILCVFEILDGARVTQRASLTMNKPRFYPPLFSRQDSNLLIANDDLIRLEDHHLAVQSHIEPNGRDIRGFSACRSYYYYGNFEVSRLPDVFVGGMSQATETRHVTKESSEKSSESHITVDPPHIFELTHCEGIVGLRHRLISEDDNAWRCRIICCMPETMRDKFTLIWPPEDSETMKLLVTLGEPKFIDTGIKRGELLKADEWFDSESY